MECREVVADDEDLARILFVLDAYGALEAGRFVAVGVSGGREELAVVGRGGLGALLECFRSFDYVRFTFECSGELAELVGPAHGVREEAGRA